MKDTHFYIILCIIGLLITFYLIHKICNSEESLDYFIYDTKIEGPTIMIIGGTHGNEPSGHYSIKKLIKQLNDKTIQIKKGKLILVPSVNYCALQVGIRMIPLIGDLNRKYPTEIDYNKKKLNNNCPIISQIVDLTNKSDFILDFHEGWGFNRIDKNSMGSSISPSLTDKSHEIAKLFLDNINNTIDDNNKKFIILTQNYKKINTNDYDYSESIDIEGSLRYYLNLINKNYILIETTGQNNIQPLETRINQCDIFIKILLKEYKLL
jgi:hypothetical protein